MVSWTSLGNVVPDADDTDSDCTTENKGMQALAAAEGGSVLGQTIEAKTSKVLHVPPCHRLDHRCQVTVIEAQSIDFGSPVSPIAMRGRGTHNAPRNAEDRHKIQVMAGELTIPSERWWMRRVYGSVADASPMGRSMVKVVPWPSWLSTMICPPWARTSWRAMARPRPLPAPPARERDRSPRQKRSKT